MRTRSAFVLCFIGVLLNSTRNLARSEPPVFPTPQFYQFLEGELTLPKGPVEVRFELPTRVEPSVRIAIDLILKGLKDLEGTTQGYRTESGTSLRQERLQRDPFAFFRPARPASKIYPVE